jgi:four helix bundle protein
VLAVLAMLGTRFARRLRVAPRGCARCSYFADGEARAALTTPVRGGWRGYARRREAWRKENAMLRIYPVYLDLVRSVRSLVKELERQDADLARQCRRALQSGSLNMSEGSYSRGGNRTARYHTSMGSVREVLSCFETGEAMGYLEPIDPAIRRKFDHVLGTLVRLVGGHN